LRIQIGFSITISCLVTVVSLIFPSVLSLQYANSIVTEEELATKELAKTSTEEKAMKELTWKNYTNSEFGFSIEYPQSFVPPILSPTDWSEGDLTITTDAYTFLFNNYKTATNSFLPSFSAELWVYLADSYEKTLKQFMYEDYLPGTIRTPIQQPTEIKIAGNTSGLEFLTKGLFGEPGKFVSFVHDKYLYVFGSEDIDSKNKQLFYDHMLNSIKFVTIANSDGMNDQIDSDDSDLDDRDRDDEGNDNDNENEDNN